MIGQSYIYIIDTEQKLNILILYRTWTNLFCTEPEHIDTVLNLNSEHIYTMQILNISKLHLQNPNILIRTCTVSSIHVDMNLYSLQYTCWYEPVQFPVYMLIRTCTVYSIHVDTNLYSLQYTCWYEPVQFTVYMLNLK